MSIWPPQLSRAVDYGRHAPEPSLRRFVYMEANLDHKMEAFISFIFLLNPALNSSLLLASPATTPCLPTTFCSASHAAVNCKIKIHKLRNSEPWHSEGKSVAWISGPQMTRMSYSEDSLLEVAA